MRERFLRREGIVFRAAMLWLAVIVIFVNVGWIFPTPNNFISQFFMKFFGPKVVVHTTTEPVQIDSTCGWDPFGNPPPPKP